MKVIGQLQTMTCISGSDLHVYAVILGRLVFTMFV